MLRLVFVWFFVCLLVGYWGRHQRGGFWGIFLFSLIFSPVIGGLGLLLAQPETPPEERSLVARVKEMAAVRAADARVARLTIAQLLVLWVLMVGFFGAVYWGYRVFIGRPSDASTALQLSLEVATLGSHPVLATGIPRELLGLERLAALLFIALLISRLVAAAHNQQTRRITATVEETVPDLKDLEATVLRQEETLAQLRALIEPVPSDRAVSGSVGRH